MMFSQRNKRMANNSKDNVFGAKLVYTKSRNYARMRVTAFWRFVKPYEQTPVCRKSRFRLRFLEDLNILRLDFDEMGILDFFKKHEPSEPSLDKTETSGETPDDKAGAIISAGDVGKEQGAYLGNLAHTAVIDQLLRVPRNDRDEGWISEFLAHVATASFACGQPQVIQGPDNFPYFQLFIPEANKAFQCYVLEHMLDDFLLDNGLGIALEPKDGEVEWVLSYGDLLHYAVHRTFTIPQDHLFGKGSEGDEVVGSDEQVLVGAPSESILPRRARLVIREFLIAQGINDPKVCLIDRSAYGKGQDLLFNLTPWQFDNEAHYQAVMRALGWFLPRYYSYSGTEEAAFKDHFVAL